MCTLKITNVPLETISLGNISFQAIYAPLAGTSMVEKINPLLRITTFRSTSYVPIYLAMVNVASELENNVIKSIDFPSLSLSPLSITQKLRKAKQIFIFMIMRYKQETFRIKIQTKNGLWQSLGSTRITHAMQ